MELNEITRNETMSSRDIAELTGKQHSHIMRDIRILDDHYGASSRSRVGLSEYRSDRGRNESEYLLTKSQSLDLAMGYNLELRIKVRERWEELEAANQFKLPSTYSEALRALAESEEEKEKSVLQLKEAEDIIKSNKPKVVFAESVSGSSNSILIRQFAKDLSDIGFKIGQNKTFEWMRENSYLMKNNEPYQQYINQGLFEVITRSIGDPMATFQKKTTKITGKGQLYFTEKILNLNKEE